MLALIPLTHCRLGPKLAAECVVAMRHGVQSMGLSTLYLHLPWATVVVRVASHWIRVKSSRGTLEECPARSDAAV